MRDHLRAGVAVHNAGYHHAAHDAWEEHWLEVKRGIGGSTASPETVPDLPADLEDPTPEADERLLHGLIQFTAAVHHLGNENWSGAQGLAERAGGYLVPLPADYRAVNVDAVRTYLEGVAADPEAAAERPVLPLTHEGARLELADLSFEATAVAAEVLAEEFDDVDEAVVDRAVEYARTDLADGDDGSRFLTLVFDFVAGEDRGIVYDRLRGHVERRRQRETDVDGLF